MSKRPKMYVVQKYVKATSASDAIRKEKSLPVDDVYVDRKWREIQGDNLAEAIGFLQEERREEE